jgi:hypothetical protein
MKFVNKYMQDHFETHPDQMDTNIIVPELNWRSKLSRITPRVAEHLISIGSGLIKKKKQYSYPLFPTQLILASNRSPAMSIVGVLFMSFHSLLSHANLAA